MTQQRLDELQAYCNSIPDPYYHRAMQEVLDALKAKLKQGPETYPEDDHCES